ncbi:MAG: tetratricopeptide repeat protein [Taibaiella sp.]|nr:tetratricopeptide repeat protein [Taibaiella sp.]
MVSNKALLLLLVSLCGGHLFAQIQGQAMVDSLIRTLPQQKEDTNKVKIFNRLSTAYYADAVCDEAFSYSIQALKLANKLKWERGIADANAALGAAYYCKSDYPKSLTCFFNALDIYERSGDKKGIANIYSGMGIDYAEQHDYANAIPYLSKALSLHKETGNMPAYARANVRMGIIYSDVKKDYPTAMAYFKEGLKVAETIGNKNTLSYAIGNMGNAYAAMGDYEAALSYMKKALALVIEMNHRANKVYAYCSIGDVYLAIAKRNAGNKRIPMPTEGTFDADRPVEQVPAGRAEQLRLAIDYMENARDAAILVGIPSLTQITLEKLANAYYEAGDYKRAIDNYRNYSAIRDSIFSVKNNEKIAQLAMTYEYNKKEAIARAEQDKKDLRQAIIRNYTLAGLAGAVIFGVVVMRQRNKVKKEKARSDELLLNILPAEVAEELKEKGNAEAKLISEVTVLFTDFKGFTQLSEKLSPKELVNEINICFSAFDKIMQKHGVEKIKTIGDAYMAAGGLPTPNKTHAEDVVRAAIEIQTFMQQHKTTKDALGEPYFEVRIGIHTGPVVAGIVGIKKFAYDIWGDTVNTAARMESSGSVGMVNLSETTYNLVKNKFNCEYRGEVEAKGKGVMKMYFVS